MVCQCIALRDESEGRLKDWYRSKVILYDTNKECSICLIEYHSYLDDDIDSKYKYLNSYLLKTKYILGVFTQICSI